MAAVVSGMLAVASVRAQEPASAREQLGEGTVESGLDGVSGVPGIAPADVAQIIVAQMTVVQTDLSQIDAPRTDDWQGQDAPPTAPTTDGKSSSPDTPKPQVSPSTPSNPDEQSGKQSKRILGIVPNYRAVSANTHLPPMSFPSELWLATQDTFDYSDFIFVAALSGIDLAGKSQPTFGQGAQGYGKYYWHVFADTGIENYMAEAIVPWATREDPRYYTMGKGGFPKRAGYALGRLFVTRTNSGKSTFNLAEIVGAGGAAGIGNLYYPEQSNPWVKTYQRWGTQVVLDGVFNMVKEFWPDINKAIFRGKY
jgi:hypothetical protein